MYLKTPYPRWHNTRGLTPGILPSSPSGQPAAAQNRSRRFVEPIDFIARLAALVPRPAREPDAIPRRAGAEPPMEGRCDAGRAGQGEQASRHGREVRHRAPCGDDVGPTAEAGSGSTSRAACAAAARSVSSPRIEEPR